MSEPKLQREKKNIRQEVRWGYGYLLKNGTAKEIHRPGKYKNRGVQWDKELRFMLDTLQIVDERYDAYGVVTGIDWDDIESKTSKDPNEMVKLVKNIYNKIHNTPTTEVVLMKNDEHAKDRLRDVEKNLARAERALSDKQKYSETRGNDTFVQDIANYISEHIHEQGEFSLESKGLPFSVSAQYQFDVNDVLGKLNTEGVAVNGSAPARNPNRIGHQGVREHVEGDGRAQVIEDESVIGGTVELIELLNAIDSKEIRDEVERSVEGRTKVRTGTIRDILVRAVRRVYGIREITAGAMYAGMLAKRARANNERDRRNDPTSRFLRNLNALMYAAEDARSKPDGILVLYPNVIDAFKLPDTTAKVRAILDISPGINPRMGILLTITNHGFIVRSINMKPGHSFQKAVEEAKDFNARAQLVHSVVHRITTGFHTCNRVGNYRTLPTRDNLTSLSTADYFVMDDILMDQHDIDKFALVRLDKKVLHPRNIGRKYTNKVYSIPEPQIVVDT
jgi:hypothetical protein